MTPLKELQNYTFVAKYARWDEEKKRRETWKEAVDRVRNMMLEKYAKFGIDEDINWAYDMMQKKKVLGSQRALQYAGPPIIKKNARCYNCSCSYCDRLRFFQESFWMLLCGVGIGVSIQKHHVAKLPKFCVHRYMVSDLADKKTYVIPDTIEGWADALGVLLSSYFDDPIFDEYYDCHVEFDYSQIRSKGSYLSSGSGQAPGPDGLRFALEKVRRILDICHANKQRRLLPINAYDIMCHISDAVLSGGVRRSATLVLFSVDDYDMMTAKTGNWRQKNPQRARANNSVLLLRDKTSYKQFTNIIQNIKGYGEPAFFLSDSTEMVPNACGEVGMYPVDIITNKTGWQGCNLSSVNCGSLVDEDDFYERCKAAAIIGTLQASFTTLKYLGETSENIFKQEALIGVSMTGMMDSFEIVLKPEVQKYGAKIIKQVNKELAKKIDINQAARTTLLKPEGTASTLLGTSAGIHPHHAKRYIRRVQNNKTERPYQFFKSDNPQACEKSVWSASNTDENILFPIEVPDGAKLKNQIPALEMLKIIKSTKQNWINSGSNPTLCVKPWLSNNVSNTVVVRPEEWGDVTKYIYDNRKHFAGISLLPLSGDKDYPQAPFTSIYTSREIVREYGNAAIWCSGLIETAMNAFDTLWAACDAILDTQFLSKLKKSLNPSSDELWKAHQQSKLYEKAHKFATKYFKGDIKKLTYCMKDVFNWKLYNDISTSFKSVDYTQMIELEDNTKPEEEVSCAGGACLV